MKPTVDQAAAYQAAYTHFNNTLFGGDLPEVLLNFSELSKSLGFYCAASWVDGSGGKIAEISISRKNMNRPLKDIMGTLVHEMTHHQQQVSGKPSRTGYHNKPWGKLMMAVGLKPDNGNGGGTGQNVSHKIIVGGKFDKAWEAMPETAKLPWMCLAGAVGAKKPIKRATRQKFQCPICFESAMARPTAKFTCTPCGVDCEKVR